MTSTNNVFGVTIILALTVILGPVRSRNATAQDDWQKLDDMPVGKWEAGAVVLDDKLYFFGGYTDIFWLLIVAI